MQLEFDRQKIASERNVVNFRKKVYEAFLICFDSSSFAVKVATMLSSLLKKIKAHHESVFVDTEFQLLGDHIKNVKIKIFDPYYAISLHIPEIDIHHIQINKVDDSFEIIIDKSFPIERLEDAIAIFNEKSRDELLGELQVKNTDLKSSLENLKRAKDDNARMESELTVGRNIQMSMLPTDFPSNENIDLHAQLVPAREVGGDFYDFQIINEHYLYFVVGDVSGKGVPAALLMAMTKSLLRSNAITEHSTKKIISHVNTEIAKENKNNMFVTIFLALLNLKTGELTYTNAGHNPSFILSENKILKLEERHGPVVGALEGYEYSEATIPLQPNDLIFAYTDGVTEAQDVDHKLYSDARLEQLLENNKKSDVKTLVEKVINDVYLFEENTEQADDITVLSVKYSKLKAADFEYSSKASLEEKEKITPLVNSFFYENNYSIGLGQKTQIVLDELISNTINHSNTNTNEEIDITLKIYLLENKDEIEILYTDNGIPFNPLDSESPNITLPLEERVMGGLGIHIIKNLAKKIEYKRQDGNNKITLLLKK